ncbi:MAG: DUF6252 family protein [Flavobacteriales bacterium]|jgi:hypothetical protein
MKSNGMLLSIWTLVLTSLLFVACNDEEEDDIETPIVCGLPNGSLKWTIDGTERCANASLFGDYGMFLTVNGITTQGQTLTMELDSLSVGTHELSADENYMLYTDNFAVVWEATNEQPGTITITGHNETTNQLNATFQINLVNPLNGQIKSISNGQLNIKYTE